MADSEQLWMAFSSRSWRKRMQSCKRRDLGGGFKYFLFSPLFGEDFPVDSYFSNGLKPPTSDVFVVFFSQFCLKDVTQQPWGLGCKQTPDR